MIATYVDAPVLWILSALIPLYEFKEMNLSKQYGITADPEVLQILDAASKVKKVRILIICWWICSNVQVFLARFYVLFIPRYLVTFSKFRKVIR